MSDFAAFSQTLVAFVATYFVHSTLLLSACWLVLKVARANSHFLTERLWKLATVLGIVRDDNGDGVLEIDKPLELLAYFEALRGNDSYGRPVASNPVLVLKNRILDVLELKRVVQEAQGD